MYIALRQHRVIYLRMMNKNSHFTRHIGFYHTCEKSPASNHVTAARGVSSFQGDAWQLRAGNFLGKSSEKDSNRF